MPSGAIILVKRQDIVAGAVDELLLTRLPFARGSPLSRGVRTKANWRKGWQKDA